MSLFNEATQQIWVVQHQAWDRDTMVITSDAYFNGNMIIDELVLIANQIYYLAKS